jgi:uncharacterized 2Fe-2S/4Fe-4S cluster protein (DUF4445 family)
MTLTVSINGRSLAPPPGATLFDCAERVGVRVPTSCVKQGKCKECMVEVAEGGALLTPRTDEERHLGPDFRLSCRARPAGEGVVRCHTLRRGAMRIEEGACGLPPRTGPPDPAVTRRGRQVLLDGEPIAGADGPLRGVAVDVGTTTVVLRLFDLESGAALATQSFENPQRFAGTDVMARIRFDGENRGRLLQRTLLGYLSHAIEAFPGDPRTIYELVVAGNTTMRDLLFGLDVQPIGQRPYRSVTEHELLEGRRRTTALSVPARRLRLPVHPAARVYGLPLLSGHVGADAAACLLASGLADAERPAAIMDLGTNTELIVGRRGRLVCASCPAGPAFEGFGISCGMPALEGAVERVRLRDDGAAELGVIGGGPPQGACGSGLIDLLGELRRRGLLNASGRFEDGSGSFAFGPLTLREEDISRLAQAKGANMAGLRIVLERYGIDAADLDRFYLAGGFARHVDVAAARRIGLIPDLPDEKIIKVGNASIEGAALALLSASRRKALEALAPGVAHVELETHPRFFDCFVDACQFVPASAHAFDREARHGIA